MIPRPVPASREVAETATPTTCEWRNCIDLAHGPMTYCDEHLRKLADAMNGPLPTPTPALAACPFCGGAAWRMVISETGNSIVKCSVCGAQTNVPYRTKEEADAAWNRRATSPDVARLRDEALDARLDALAAKVEALEAFRSAANNTFNAHGQEMEEISGTMEVCAKGIQGVRERVDKIKPKVHHIPNDAGVMAHIQIAELHRLLAIVLDHAEFAPGQETAEAAIRRALREGAPQPSTGAGVVSEREDATARRTAAPTVEQVVSAVLRVVPVAGSDYGGKSGLVYRADVEQVIRALYAKNEKPPMTDRTPLSWNDYPWGNIGPIGPNAPHDLASALLALRSRVEALEKSRDRHAVAISARKPNDAPPPSTGAGVVSEREAEAVYLDAHFKAPKGRITSNEDSHLAGLRAVIALCQRAAVEKAALRDGGGE